MTVTTSEPSNTIVTSEQRISQLKGETANFDLAVALASLWMILGVFIDGWAHANLPETEETFFTPWHGVLYSGFFVAAGIISYAIFFNYMLTQDVRSAIPKGYGSGFVGVILFLAGGVVDMLWHTFIGIESDIEALFSPTHLMLMVGAFMITSGIMRKALLDNQQYASTKGKIALVLSAVGAIGIIIFFTQFSHPYRSDIITTPNAEGDFSYIRDGQQFMGFIFHATLLVGFVYFLIRNFDLSAPFMGLFVTLPLMLTTILEPTLYLLPAAILSGLFVIPLVVIYNRSDNVLVKRVFGGLVALTVFGLYYINQAMVNTIGWSLDLWTGSLTVVFLIGILVSFLFHPIEATE